MSPTVTHGITSCTCLERWWLVIDDAVEHEEEEELGKEEVLELFCVGLCCEEEAEDVANKLEDIEKFVFEEDADWELVHADDEDDEGATPAL